MRRQHGLITLSGDTGTVHIETCRCPHCGGIFTLAPRQAPPGSCMNCGGAFVCQHCAGKPCSHFLKRIEDAERRDRLRRQLTEDYR